MDIASVHDYLIRVLQKLFRREKLLIDKFPGDILTNILIRLPAKQVAQFRCVSKTWNAFLSQPYFIKSHLDYSLQNNDEILLVFNEQFHWKPEPCIAHLTKSLDMKLIDLIKLPVNFPDPDQRESGSVIGSVNGLICFSCRLAYPWVIHIWNPSLSALMTLPPSTDPSTGFKDFFGFGFDPKTDDYKVVRLTKKDTIYSDPLIPEWLQVEVYSMRKSCWEFVAAKFPSKVIDIFNRNEVCIDGHDGHFHWICSYVAEGIKFRTIVAFDLGEETFSEISLPDSITKFETRRAVNFHFFAGRLCVMSRTIGGRGIEVWVMNEYGVAKSWVKQHMLSQLSGTDMLPIGFTLNNDFLFGSPYPLALYDPDTTQVKYLGTNANPFFRTKVVQYVDSLVWVAPAKRGNTTCIVSS